MLTRYFDKAHSRQLPGWSFLDSNLRDEPAKTNLHV